MMTPQKFASVRYKRAPSSRMAPFRDDTSLVALRYEQTAQAEPPIPLPPPKNPRRLSRPQSTITASTPTYSPTYSPIVILPPPIPPQDVHPLFRTRTAPRFRADSWKRDSGLAPSTTSVTVRQDEDDCANDKLITEFTLVPPPACLRDESQPPQPPQPPQQHDTERTASPDLARSTLPWSTPSEIFTVPLLPAAPETPSGSPTDLTELSEPLTPTRSSIGSITKRLGKTFSRSGHKRLRRKSINEDEDSLGSASPPGSPAEARGSLKSLKSAPLDRRSVDKEECNSIRSLPTAAESRFIPITTQIPEESLWDDFNRLSFSHRGSVMFGGKRAIDKNGPLAHSFSMAETLEPDPTGNATDEKTRASMSKSITAPSIIPSIRVLPVDIERESQKVRSLYESADGLHYWLGSERISSLAERLETPEEDPSEGGEYAAASMQSSIPPSDCRASSPAPTTPRSASSLSHRRDSQARQEYELAGGLEDWENVEGADVDRYGFISQHRPGSRANTPDLRSSQLASRRRNVLTKRPGSSYSSSSHLRPGYEPSSKLSARSLNTYTSEASNVTRRSTRSSIRSAANRLPHNRNRRWMDEAGDMLTLQPGLTDIAEDMQSTKIADALKRKEWERSEKWRKMAKIIKKGADGAGMEFEFDPKNPKLIERTWKGIPDCWRAAAWRSFLLSSAKTWEGRDTENDLQVEFRRLQEMGSPDDVQIDLDVPRTINRHIMFRKRYRGGQRLLFRVLHAISLYFPDVGYVQGMASLAATLLCYYDEERCFVMMVRMWKYRGLERLYQPGFGGLMSALHDFERRWLGGTDVAKKLSELDIDSTAYGTRWYLTLFNLSVPFPAQLRIWDVFMLLGECSPEQLPATSSDKTKDKKRGRTPTSPSPPPPPPPSVRGFDVLHAASGALIQALREVLLDSDFENAMKALTSWVPVKDEELLMKVARAEWKQHAGKRKEKT